MKTNAITRILAAAMLAVAAMPAFADTRDALLKVEKIKVARVGNELMVSMNIDPAPSIPAATKR